MGVYCPRSDSYSFSEFLKLISTSSIIFAYLLKEARLSFDWLCFHAGNSILSKFCFKIRSLSCIWIAYFFISENVIEMSSRASIFTGLYYIILGFYNDSAICCSFYGNLSISMFFEFGTFCLSLQPDLVFRSDLDLRAYFLSTFSTDIVGCLSLASCWTMHGWTLHGDGWGSYSMIFCLFNDWRLSLIRYLTWDYLRSLDRELYFKILSMASARPWLSNDEIFVC